MKQKRLSRSPLLSLWCLCSCSPASWCGLALSNSKAPFLMYQGLRGQWRKVQRVFCVTQGFRFRTEGPEERSSSPFSESPEVGIQHLLSSKNLWFRVAVLKTDQCWPRECVRACHSFSFLVLWCSGSEAEMQSCAGGSGSPLRSAADVGRTAGSHLVSLLSPVLGLPAGCGAAQVVLPLHGAYRHLQRGAGSGGAPHCSGSWGNNTPLQEEACGCLSSCVISGCGEILGKSWILTGLEETSSVRGNRNSAPNQRGKQNPRPNQKVFLASQPLPAPLARAEQRDPSFAVWAETLGSGLWIAASPVPARIT